MTLKYFVIILVITWLYSYNKVYSYNKYSQNVVKKYFQNIPFNIMSKTTGNIRVWIIQSCKDDIANLKTITLRNLLKLLFEIANS